jgi:hypothetical protein
MRCALTCIVVLLCAASVIAQGNPEGTDRQSSVTALPGPESIKSAARQGRKAAHSSAAVRPDAPVVTLKGVCNRLQKGGSGCKTVITRAEIDSMLNLLEPNASPVTRHQFAINYARLVAVFGVAQRRHLEKDPAVASAVQMQMQQKLVRMQVMANILYHQIEAQVKNVPAV